MKPQITLVGTPIGNLQDASPRMIAALKAADVIYAEHPDTSKKLAQVFQLGEKKWVLFDQNTEQGGVDRLIRDSEQMQVAVISRAGMPAINDPGVYLVRYLLDHKIAFDVVPGPSIVTCLMATAGSFGPFHYFGYFPKKSQEAESQLFFSAQDGGVALYLESPHRIHKTLQWIKTYLGACPSARLVVLREMTKLHQMIFGGRVVDITVDDHHPAVGEWALSISVAAAELPSTYKLIPTSELEKLLRQPYPQRLAKFAKKYGLNYDG